MDKVIKSKWIKALRSGKYKQAQSSLCDIDPDGKARFCCLGVLTDLYMKDHKQCKWDKGTGTKSIIKSGKRQYFGTLPSFVYKWAKLKDSNPTIPKGVHINENLAHLNDSKELSFKRIANLIEKYL